MSGALAELVGDDNVNIDFDARTATVQLAVDSETTPQQLADAVNAKGERYEATVNE